MNVALAPTRLVVRIALCNTGDDTMPGGIGLHPYLRHEPVQPVCYEATAPWTFDDHYLALPGVPAGPIGPRTLDSSDFGAGEVTLFHGAWQGALRVMDPGTHQATLELSANDAFTQLVIHRPAGSPYLCAEPVSHVADGFNLAARGQAGTGTRILAPGERLEGTLVLAT